MEVGCLEEPVLTVAAALEKRHFLCERELDGSVKGLGNYLLAVVVVDLHLVELLEVIEVVEQEH